METRFKAGDVVESLVTAQGLVAGKRYSVTHVRNVGALWMTLTTYTLCPIGNTLTLIDVVNGHLLLKGVE